VSAGFRGLAMAMNQNAEARLDLSELLMSLVQRTEMDGLTLWRTPAGWQAAIRVKGSDGFTVAVNEDPVQAIQGAAVARFVGKLPEFVGFGLAGPVSPAMKRLRAAILDNAAAREAMGQ